MALKEIALLPASQALSPLVSHQPILLGTQLKFNKKLNRIYYKLSHKQQSEKQGELTPSLLRCN